MLSASIPTSDDDYVARMMIGASVSTNQKSMLKAKAHLEESPMRVGEILTEGEAEEVYDLSFQLVPLSKNS